MSEAVILTGATGFVGRAVLAELVIRGIPVHAVSRSPGPGIAGVTWHSADLLRAEGRARVSTLAPRLVHCAWEVEHGVFWTSHRNQIWREVSRDLVRRFRSEGGGQVLALGTCAEYDPVLSGLWSETRPLRSTTPYGEAKASLHADLATLCGSDLIWARLFHLYGPGEDRRRFVPSLIDALCDGRPAEVRAAKLERDFASTAHVARCLVGLLQMRATGIFNVGSGEIRPLGDLARVLAWAIGRPDLLKLSHRPGPGDPQLMAPDLTRLRAHLGDLVEFPEIGLMDLLHDKRGVVAELPPQQASRS
ncbi:MAG: NAD(P)-dependent oxidoreductase [Gemmobacter sp.]|jgi:nucleoside-diphosphate-sugar epimerase|nr:NAD(P)-dependent oxidoreductase [Gemmobacter sp.]